jgi:hypothetical protein
LNAKDLLAIKMVQDFNAIDCQAQSTDSGVFEADVWLRVGVMSRWNNTTQFVYAD